MGAAPTRRRRGARARRAGAAGGGIASSALVYSVAIPLSATTRVRTRAYNAGAPEFNWSAPGDATYGINVPAAAGDFAITEIHYHPLQASAAETNAGYFSENDFEFIETGILPGRGRSPWYDAKQNNV